MSRPPKTSRPGLAHRLLPALVLLLLGSCGTLAYDRDWDRFEPRGDGSGMVGRWKGGWESEWNGHSGGLRCMLSPLEDGTFLARFHSTYARVLSFRHEMVFRVTREVTGEEDGRLEFEGEQDLGKAFGGVYRYDGSVVGDSFEAFYEADNGDHGVFRMKRVADARDEGDVRDDGMAAGG